MIFDDLTRQRSTFTRSDLARAARRAGVSLEQIALDDPAIVALGFDRDGNERFTTRAMLDTEIAMIKAAGILAGRRRHAVTERHQGRALADAERGGLRLGDDQKAALAHILTGPDLVLVVGHAGTGKSAMLAVARAAWERQGYRVTGAALSGIAAAGLSQQAGIRCQTLAASTLAWQHGRDRLQAKDILVIDEAGMIGSAQMRHFLDTAAGGAKLVLLGDYGQLQGIEAGAAFRVLVERHGATAIHDIRRQLEAWQRSATRDLATGRTAAAIERYDAAGMVRMDSTRAAARAALLKAWDRARLDGDSQIILAYSRAEVHALNTLARRFLAAAGHLRSGRTIETSRGPRVFAPGDAILFLRNDRRLGVKNGTIGEVIAADGRQLEVFHDDGLVRFDPGQYREIDHGYAVTVHKAQGMTVDRAFVLAEPAFDRHLAYVAMSRHRASLSLHWAKADFGDTAGLAAVLGREGGKDSTLDYVRAPEPAPRPSGLLGRVAAAWRSLTAS